MENISIKEKYNLTNLGRKSNIEEICKQLIVIDKDLILDLRECNIDYPATSILLDHILKLLSKLKDEKEIIILYDINFEEIITLQYFVVGSSFLHISKKFQDIEDYRKAINKKLSDYKITFTIKIMENDSLIKTYKYGSERD